MTAIADMETSAPGTAVPDIMTDRAIVKATVTVVAMAAATTGPVAKVTMDMAARAETAVTDPAAMAATPTTAMVTAVTATTDESAPGLCPPAESLTFPDTLDILAFR